MWFSKKQTALKPVPAAAPATPATPAIVPTTSKKRGSQAEAVALAHLQRHGLRLVARNFKTPGRGGGEVDLIMREPDGTLVFVEVRQRSSAQAGGAGASITPAKQRRIVLAARHFLLRWGSQPPCRFDAVLIHGPLGAAQLDWLPAAFDASSWA